MKTFQPFSIILTNEGLNVDGSTNIIKTRDGFPIHTFPETLVLPKLCKIKWVNLTINEIPSEKELYVCIQELPNICFIGDGVQGRKIKGFLGLVNHLDTTSNVFSNFPYIHLRNTEPISIPQMTLQIYTNNGKASSFSSDLIYYNFNEGNNWTSTGTGAVFEMRATSNKHIWEAVNTATGLVSITLIFDEKNPNRFTTSTLGLIGYYDTDTFTPSADVGNLIFSNGSHWETSLAPQLVSKTDVVAKYALELRVEKE